ncbi:MAG: FeoB-associated Cys-rich membrane protein [Clostridia bacterium]|nr:FeoB-associated Cys-rich membrane protein [Clostridia bacterium]
MKDYVIIAIIALAAGPSLWYIIRSKKKGKKCIGCPDSCCCSEKSCASCKNQKA